MESVSSDSENCTTVVESVGGRQSTSKVNTPRKTTKKSKSPHIVCSYGLLGIPINPKALGKKGVQSS